MRKFKDGEAKTHGYNDANDDHDNACNGGNDGLDGAANGRDDGALQEQQSEPIVQQGDTVAEHTMTVKGEVYGM